MSLQMKQLPCTKQYVLGKHLKTIITMTSNQNHNLLSQNMEFYLILFVNKFKYRLRNTKILFQFQT